MSDELLLATNLVKHYDISPAFSFSQKTLVRAVDGDDEDAFHTAFEEMLDVIRKEGEHLGDEEIETSDVIVPPADTSMAEATAEFSGEGLIPD